MIRNVMDKLATFFSVAATVSADTDGASVDGQSILSLTYLVSVAAFTFTGSNKIALRILHSDDNVNFTEATFANNELYAPVKELTTAGDGAKTHYVEYRGNKRYTKLQLDVSGTVSVAVAACAVGIAKLKPADAVVSLA